MYLRTRTILTHPKGGTPSFSTTGIDAMPTHMYTYASIQLFLKS